MPILKVDLPPNFHALAAAQAEDMGVTLEDFALLAIDAYIRAPAAPPERRVPHIIINGQHIPAQIADGRLWLRWMAVHRSGIVGRSLPTLILHKHFSEDDQRKLVSDNYYAPGPSMVIHVAADVLRDLIMPRPNSAAAVQALDSALALV